MTLDFLHPIFVTKFQRNPLVVSLTSRISRVTTKLPTTDWVHQHRHYLLISLHVGISIVCVTYKLSHCRSYAKIAFFSSEAAVYPIGRELRGVQSGIEASIVCVRHEIRLPYGMV